MKHFFLLLLLFLICMLRSSAQSCSASETKNMLACTKQFFEVQGFYENDGKNAPNALKELAHSWAAVEKMCDAYHKFIGCLKPSTIKNCISLENDKSKKGKFDISPSAIYFAANPICIYVKADVKRVYSAIDEYCPKVEKSSCYDFAKSFTACTEIIERNVKGVEKYIVSTVLLSRECPKMKFNCQFCPSTTILEQILSYRNADSFNDDLLMKLAKDAASSEISTQIEAVSHLIKLLSSVPTFPLDVVIENGIHRVLLDCLYSKSSELQLQALTALSLIIEDYSNAIIEAEGIPALIRTLSATDVKILEKTTKILAKILEKYPSQKQEYLEQNILKPLLLSFTPDILKEMSHDISSIVYHLCSENGKSSFSFLRGRTIIESLLPLLSELVYDFPPADILKTAKSLLVIALESNNEEEVGFDIYIVQKIHELMNHKNLEIQSSATLAAGFIVNWIDKVTKDESGKSILEKYAESTSDDDDLEDDNNFLKTDDKDNAKSDNSRCTASQSNKMTICLAHFVDETALSKNPMGLIDQALSSWNIVENLCSVFKTFKECLGPTVIKNCVNIKTKVKTMSDYMDFALGWVFFAGNTICETQKQDIQRIYSCIASNCNLNFDSSCSTSEIDQCKEATKTKCHLKHFEIGVISQLLEVKKCIKNPDCSFCDKEIAAQIKAYKSLVPGKKRWESSSDKEKLDQVDRLQSALRYFNEL